jgi:hypothetical protein
MEVDFNWFGGLSRPFATQTKTFNRRGRRERPRGIRKSWQTSWERIKIVGTKDSGQA